MSIFRSINTLVAMALIWVLFSLLSISNAQAQIVLDPKNAPFDVITDATVALAPVQTIQTDGPPYDHSKIHPLSDILEWEDQNEFAPITTRRLGLPAFMAETVFAVYVNIPVENPLDTDTEWTLAFNQNSDYFYVAYLVVDGEPLPTEPFFHHDWWNEKWTGTDAQIHTEFTMPAASKGTVYVAFENLGTGAPITIEVPEQYAAKRLLQDLHFFGLAGLTLGLVIITVFLIATLRSFAALFYAGAVLSGLITVVTGEMYVETFLPFEFFWDDEETWLYSMPAAAGFALLFQQQFFANQGLISRWYRWFLLGIATIFLCMPFLMFSFLGPVGGMVAMIVLYPLVTINGFIAFFKRIVGRWTFMLGSLTISASIMLKFLSFNLTPHIALREVSMVMLYALALESILLAMTMFTQVRAVRAEREQAMQNEMRSTQEKLEMARTMAHAAHDLQQPLASLRMSLAQMSDDPKSGAEFHKAIDYLESIVRKQMVDTREDTISVSQSEELSEIEESGDEVFPINIVLANMMVMFAEEAKNKGISLRMVDTAAKVEGNIFAVMRIASNLVSNAVKNTSAGGVLIGCRRRGNYLCLDVLDSGHGMEKEAIETLQKPLRRTGSYEGTGLGLDIVNKLASEHSWKLDIDSLPGQGTRFRLWLPKAG